jgi:hypothetical protein
MVFKIVRTSSPSAEREWHYRFPCDEAYVASHEYAYRDTDGAVCYWNTYEVEIGSLQDLVEFSKKYGEIIISVDTLEIYDDYRE